MIIHETIANESDIQRFESYIIPEPNTGCWIWLGCTMETGYGRFNLNKRNTFAHRVSYALYKSNAPSGLLICHTCDNRWCVNPDHLYIGTHSENNLDAYRRRKRKNIQGVNGSNTKLCNEDVFFIRSSQLTRKLLAEKFNVSVPLIGKIQRRLLWKHI